MAGVFAGVIGVQFQFRAVGGAIQVRVAASVRDCQSVVRGSVHEPQVHVLVADQLISIQVELIVNSSSDEVPALSNDWLAISHSASASSKCVHAATKVPSLLIPMDG